MDYWEREARRLQQEKDDNDKYTGCLALVLIVVGAILYCWISAMNG